MSYRKSLHVLVWCFLMSIMLMLELQFSPSTLGTALASIHLHQLGML